VPKRSDKGETHPVIRSGFPLKGVALEQEIFVPSGGG
jgi:hypothetical protein